MKPAWAALDLTVTTLVRDLTVSVLRLRDDRGHVNVCKLLTDLVQEFRESDPIQATLHLVVLCKNRSRTGGVTCIQELSPTIPHSKSYTLAHVFMAELWRKFYQLKRQEHQNAGLRASCSSRRLTNSGRCIRCISMNGLLKRYSVPSS